MLLSFSIQERCGLNLGDYVVWLLHLENIPAMVRIGESTGESCNPQDYGFDYSRVYKQPVYFYIRKGQMVPLSSYLNESFGVVVRRYCNRNRRCVLKDTSTKSMYYRTMLHKQQGSDSQNASIYIK